ncbi:MAG: hypothetical protein JJE52_12050 [Acidimicrobiia bacterium]|nr:hypothetical protein [Acidimicrobiia bacterium]
MAVLLTAAVLLASCGGGDDDGGDGAAPSTTGPTGPGSTSTSDAATTTSSSTTTSTSSTTTTALPPPPPPPPKDRPPEIHSGLPLVPTTTTLPIDRAIDPPPALPPPPPPPGRNSVFVLGDSVFLGTTRAIPHALSDWVVTYDAVGSRRLAQGIDVLAARRGEIGEAVVIHLGNNYIERERDGYGSQIDEAMTVLHGVPRVVWVTVSEVSDSRREINAAIREAATRWPTMRVADWAPIIEWLPHLAWDGMHLTPEGRREVAALIDRTLGEIVPD